MALKEEELVHRARDNPETLSGVSRDELLSESRQLIVQLEKIIDRETSLVYLDGLHAANTFWSIQKELLAQHNESDKPSRYGTRVRMLGNTVSATWYENRFYTDGPNRRLYSNHIRINANGSYSVTRFPGLRDWEKEGLQAIENRYIDVRKRSEKLSRIRRLLKEYRALLADD